MHGICHIEIPCADFDRAGKFYKTAFDWKTELIPVMDYMTFKTPDGVGGGFNKQLKPAPKDVGVFIYIFVEDIDTALKKIDANGGKVTVKKSPIPGVGHYGVFIDTEGNSIGLFSA